MKPLDFEHYEHITQNVCLDAGYVGKADVASRHGMVPHIRPRGEEKKAIELHGFRPKHRCINFYINKFQIPSPTLRGVAKRPLILADMTFLTRLRSSEIPPLIVLAA